MIEILNMPLPATIQFKDILDQRGVPNRVTWRIPQRISESIVKPESVKRALSWRIKNRENPVVIGGAGSYHHLTYGLCANLKRPFGYIHIDRHSDFGDQALPYICMGGFVESLITHTSAQAGLLIGCDQRTEIPTIPYTHLGELEERLSKELLAFPQEVYISVDLDVLDPSQFNSGYDTGKMKVEQLFHTLDSISRKKSIIGGDIFGCAENDKNSFDVAIDCILKIHDNIRDFR